MTLQLTAALLREIHHHGESHYPYEGAGLMLGRVCDRTREVIAVRPLNNRAEARLRGYRITPQDMLAAELEAERLEFDILGIFHSHPDSAAQPSQHDLDTAYPWFSYVITSIQAGEARRTRSWRLQEGSRLWREEQITLAASGLRTDCG